MVTGHCIWLSITDKRNSSALLVFLLFLLFLVLHCLLRFVLPLHFTFFFPSQMVKIMEEYLDDYNQINTAQMKLVLFGDAVRHVARISRVIRQPLGNALLLGVGGSGRQSLTRLAAHM